MPSGIYKREPFTEGHKRKMRKIAKEKGFGLWMIGKHLSEETKEKIRRARKGNSYPHKGHIIMEETKKKIKEAQIGEKGYWFGKHRSKETKDKMSESHRGEKSYLWRGGKSPKPYTIQFSRELRGLIRQRDNYQYQLCGMPEIENIKKLSIHHIDYNKKNCLPSNLISLCINCHIKTNHNRNYWIEYFTKEEV